MKGFARSRLFLFLSLMIPSAGSLAQTGSEFVPRGGGEAESTAEEICRRAGCDLAPQNRQIVPAGGLAGTPTLADGGTGIRWFYSSDPFPASGTGVGRGIVPRHQMVASTQSNPAVLYNFEFHPPLGSDSMHFSLQVQTSFISQINVSQACLDSLVPEGRTMAIFLQSRLRRVDTNPVGVWQTLRLGDVGQVPATLPLTSYPTRHYTNFLPIVSAFDSATNSYPRYQLLVEAWPVPSTSGNNLVPFSFDCFVPLNPAVINLGLAITSTQMNLTF